MAIDPRTPVLVGVGSITQHGDDRDPAELLEPVDLMVAAVRAAAEDAQAPGLLSAVELIAVPKGIWGYGDPGRFVAERIGASASTRTVLAEVGILQQTVIDQACAAIAAGELEVAVVCGGEARNRAVRAARAGTEAGEADAPGPPDELQIPAGEIITGVEIERDLAVPAHQYALVESVLRHLDGLSADAAAGSARCALGSVRRRGRHQPGGLGPFRSRRRRDRRRLGRKPDDRLAVHEAAVLAVERRSGRCASAHLGRRRRTGRRAS